MFLSTGKWCDAVAPAECLAAAYEYLVAGQDRGVEHGYVGWELCHCQGGLRYVCCQSATMGQIGTRENCCYGEATLSFLTVRL